MKAVNGVKIKPKNASKMRQKNAPKPTTYSNLRSQNYLTHFEAESDTADCKTATNVERQFNACSKLEHKLEHTIDLKPAEEIKNHRQIKIQKLTNIKTSNTTPLTNKLRPHDFPQSTRAKNPIKFDDPKSNWKDDTIPFMTERQTSKNEFGPVHVQRLEKLEPKILPINSDSIIDTSIVSNNPDVCLYDKVKKSNNNVSNGVKTRKKSVSRSRSEQRQKQIADKETVLKPIEFNRRYTMNWQN